MKYLIITTISLLTIFQTGQAQSNLDELIAVPLSQPGERGMLEIGLVHGGIEVQGYDGDEVIIKAESKQDYTEDHRHDDWGHDDEHDDREAQAGLKKISSNAMEIEVTERNNRVSVSSNSWNRGINFTVQVPKNFDLQLSTVNGGDIVVENVNGALEINNVNGEVSATQISGSALIDTVNGRIKASFKKVSNDTPMAFTTLNGNVDIALPPNVKATFKMKSDRGEIYSDFDMDVDQSGPKVDRSTQGSFKVTIENWVYGKVNGGGPEFMFNNMNGNIYIRKID